MGTKKEITDLPEIVEQLTADSKRIADALELLAAIEKRREEEYFRAQAVAAAKAREAERALWESWKGEQLSLQGPQTCVYCDSLDVALIVRGSRIFGCTKCVGDIMPKEG